MLLCYFHTTKKSTVNGKPKNSGFFLQGPGPIFQVWSLAFNLLQPSNTFATVPKNMPVERPTGPASLKPASIFCCRWLGRLGTRHYNVPLFAVHDFTLLFISHYPNVKLTTNCSITKWLWVEAASIRTSYFSPGCWVFMVAWASPKF